jgi:transposase InsO family protein
MDDILVYSKDRKEHVEQVRKILGKLQRAGLQADIKKCEFFVTETKFLGLIVGPKGISIDLERVRTVQEWDVPRNLSDVRAFNGFLNFYRRFIKGYSKLMKPLTDLTRKDVPFVWDERCQAAFQRLKDCITKAPVLRHFDRTRTCYVECDASDYVSAGVLSQKDDEGVLHPVAYFSRKMSPAECNYEIYDKELLAIIRCFEEWRPDLEGSELPVQVLTDHKSLEYFMSTKRLTRRQARWAEFLADYHFEITYRPGKQNQKADALTRRTGDLPLDAEDDRQKEMSRTILTPERLHPNIRCKLQLISPAGWAKSERQVISPIEPTLEDQIREAQANDKFCQETIKLLNEEARTSSKISLAHCAVQDRLLTYRGKVWIPEEVRVEAVKEVHVQPMVGHTGVGRTLTLLKRQFYWPRMDQTVTRYIANCHDCRRAKPNQDAYNGVLVPLPIPQQPWQDISLDFVTGLPEDPETRDNAILVTTCRLTKERHFSPCKATDEGTTAEATAEMLIRDVIRLHGLPDTVVSDRGPQFISEVWRHLCRILQIQTKLSTAFHPETDGQTEAENKEMERYLRTYVDYLQIDWKKWLALAEFACNNAPSATTKISPFFANKGFNPRMSFDIRLATKEPRNPGDVRNRAKAEELAVKMKGIWDFLQDQIGLAQTRMEHFADQNRKPAPAYQPGDKVWLSSKNIRTQRPSKKLDSKNLGPFEIVKKVGATSYELKLPASMRIHPVFHSNLLRLDPDTPLPGQIVDPPPPVVIDDEEEYEVAKVLDSRRCGRGKKLQYKVDWVGYPPDLTWYDATNFDNSPEVVREFHVKYPRKPGP